MDHTPEHERSQWLSRLFDLREGEAKTTLFGFGALLLLIITAHTVLETARDTLLLVGPGPRALGVVYVGIAACTLPSAALAVRVGARFGPRRALSGTLALAAVATVLLFMSPASHASAITIYITSGVIASVVVPQFWTLVAAVFTLAQGRRLFGLIAAAGVLGGVAGSGTAAAMLRFVPAKSLLLVSAALFAIAGAALILSRRLPAAHGVRPHPSRTAAESTSAFRDQPFVVRVALLVFLSTATLLAVDYCFKSAVARSLPPAQIGPFVARFHLGFNLVALFVQLFVAGPLVRRLGVATAIAVTPLLVFLGAASVVLSAGALGVVLLLKGIDGALRHSVHRITDELMYLPIPAGVRQRVKPLIDGALGRAAQTIAGASLLALGGTRALAPLPLAVSISCLALLWLSTALSMRRPYLDLLRHALSKGSSNGQDIGVLIDLDRVRLLVPHLASEDRLEVLGAMSLLSRAGHGTLISALVLLHHDEEVLVSALQIFGASGRSDWLSLGRRLLAHPKESIRMAAARALARHDELDPRELTHDVGPQLRAYALLRYLVREGDGPLLEQPSIAKLLDERGESGVATRLGLLAAAADAPATARLIPLLLAMSHFTPGMAPTTELFAQAAAHQANPRLIAPLVSLLTAREGREAVRAALVAMGDPAFEAVHAVLLDPAAPRPLRIHAPKTLARFRSKRAADCLLRAIEDEGDGLVRYKCIRALGWLVGDRKLVLDRARVERQCRRDLIEHFRLQRLGETLASDGRAPGEPHGRAHAGRFAAERLLFALLEEKRKESLERAFQLLNVAHPAEELHRVYLSCLSGDAFARATAGEFLVALLRRRAERPVRDLLRLVSDDLPDGRRDAQAAALTGLPQVRSREEALTQLLRGVDPMVAALAMMVATEGHLQAAVSEGRSQRPTAGAFGLDLASKPTTTDV